MVSLRRKKYGEATQGEKRRSARLLKLQQQKDEKISCHMLQMDRWQEVENGKSSLQKRGRKRNVRDVDQEAYCTQEVGSSDNGNSSSNPSASRIIEYILDVLELKDTNELFTMPDNIQINDYSERVNKPGDFATLRQKLKDGMYQTLEQFESDVYMVFNKAMATNDRDTIKHREALCFQDQAKQVFQSLKENRTYSELELSAWHQKYFSRRRRPVRNAGTPCYATQPQRNVRPKIQTDIKKGNSPRNMIEDERGQSSNSNLRFQRKLQSVSDTSLQAKKDPLGCSKPCIEERRYNYKAESDSNCSLVSIFSKQHRQLLYNGCAPSYQESLRHFVKNAGKEAKMVAERMCEEYNERIKVHSMASNCATRLSNFLPCHSGYYRNLYSQNSIDNKIVTDVTCNSTNGTLVSNTGHIPNCKLETDELLRLFSVIGTPEFLERSNSILPSNSSITTKPDQSYLSLLNGEEVETAAAAQSSSGGFSSGNQVQQPLNLEKFRQKSMYDLPFSTPKLGKSKFFWEQKGMNDRPSLSFLPPKGSFSSLLGFSQYAKSVQPFKVNPQNVLATQGRA